VSVVRCPETHPAFPNMPVVIFPGNVGGDDALLTAYRRLSRRELGQSQGHGQEAKAA